MGEEIFPGVFAFFVRSVSVSIALYNTYRGEKKGGIFVDFA